MRVRQSRKDALVHIPWNLWWKFPQGKHHGGKGFAKQILLRLKMYNPLCISIQFTLFIIEKHDLFWGTVKYM